MQKKRNIILYIMNLPGGATDVIHEYGKATKQPMRVMLLRDSRVKDYKNLAETPGLDIYETCDFSKPSKIAEALLPYQDQLVAVTCRTEQGMARFRSVLPHVPYLRTPTTESLQWASDKYEMRKRLYLYNKKLTPSFTRVKMNSKAERARTMAKVGFPMIVKPANLAGSRFVSICYHEEELEKVLRGLFRKINKAYEKENRLEEPKVIAESYMEGEMYSVDSYVNSRGRVWHCPLVKVTTGKNIGHDDFYNYLQMTPTGLKSTTVAKAEAVAEEAVYALGLRSTLTHIELMKIDDEWKIIEIGARMGGFRHLLHTLSCDINHSLNDVLVRVPKKPIIPKKCKGYACAMKWFAEKEGKITELKGIKKIEQLKSFHSIQVNKKIGNRAIFARNGGLSVFNLFLYNQDRSKLLADIRRAEQLVNIKIAARSTKK